MLVFRIGTAILFMTVFVLSGCNSDNTSSESPVDAPDPDNTSSESPVDAPDPDNTSSEPPVDVVDPEVMLSINSTKRFTFSWQEQRDVDHYQLYENQGGDGGYELAVSDIPGVQTEYSYKTALYDRLNSSFILTACYDSTCRQKAESNVAFVDRAISNAIGEITPSTPNAGDKFGYSLALSRDGRVLAVGSPFEDSNANGVNPSQGELDNSSKDSGAVYIFEIENDQWVQKAYIKTSDSTVEGRFGFSLSLDTRGNTLIVGAPQRNVSRIDDPTFENTCLDDDWAGAAYIFSRNEDNVWVQDRLIQGPSSCSYFGYSVSVNAAGNIFVAGAPTEGLFPRLYSSDLDSDFVLGAAYVYLKANNVWSLQQRIALTPDQNLDVLGALVAIDSAGDSLAIRAWPNSLSDQTENTNSSNGSIFVYQYSDEDGWEQEQKIASNYSYDVYDSISLSGDGNTLAFGVPNSSSSSHVSRENDLSDAGAVYIYQKTGSLWRLSDYLTASNQGSGDLFGLTTQLNTDGTRLIVGSPKEDGSSSGLAGADDNSSVNSGAAYVFEKNSTGAWSQTQYIKAKQNSSNGFFGFAVALSDDQSTLAVSSLNEKEFSSNVPFDPNFVDSSSFDGTGTVYLY